MEKQQEETMSTKDKLLLLEYSKIALKRIDGAIVNATDADSIRMKKIQETLGLTHDELLRTASDFLGGTISQ